jgi:hypothetical protein
MMTDILCHAIEEIELCQLPDLAPAIAKALAVMKALQCILDPPHAMGLEHALANLDVSALVDEGGWPQIRYTLGD